MEELKQPQSRTSQQQVQGAGEAFMFARASIRVRQQNGRHGERAELAREAEAAAYLGKCPDQQVGTAAWHTPGAPFHSSLVTACTAAAEAMGRGYSS